MKTTDFITENQFIGDDAHAMHQDHEVQMARSDCYSSAKYAIDLHKMLKNVDETTGLDGWVSEKITLANDYLRTVHEYLSHEMSHPEEDMPEVFTAALAEARFAELLGETTGKQVDMTGKPCTACKKGTYEETDQHDDMDGVLHCTKCRKSVKRHQPANPNKKGMSEGVLGDIGSEIAHGAKGLKRKMAGKPSRQDVKDKYRDRSDAAYNAGDRKDAKKNADRWEKVHNKTNDGMMEEQDVAEQYNPATAIMWIDQVSQLAQSVSQLSPEELVELNDAFQGFYRVAGGVTAGAASVGIGNMFYELLKDTLYAAKNKARVDTDEILTLQRQIISIHKMLKKVKTEPTIAKYQAMLKQAYEVLAELEARQGNQVAEGEANAGDTLRSRIIKLYKRGLEDYDIAYDLNISEKIVADIIDDYDRKQQQRHAKQSGVAEGSISDLLNQDPTSPKFNDHPGASQLKKAKGQNEFTGKLDSKGRFTKGTVKNMFGKLSPDAKGVSETTSSAGMATAPGVGKGPKTGTLFGGSYAPRTPFTAKKKTSVIKR